MVCLDDHISFVQRVLEFVWIVYFEAGIALGHFRHRISIFRDRCFQHFALQHVRLIEYLFFLIGTSISLLQKRKTCKHKAMENREIQQNDHPSYQDDRKTIILIFKGSLTEFFRMSRLPGTPPYLAPPPDRFRGTTGWLRFDYDTTRSEAKSMRKPRLETSLTCRLVGGIFEMFNYCVELHPMCLYWSGHFSICGNCSKGSSHILPDIQFH